jgi:hypothetical protein
LRGTSSELVGYAKKTVLARILLDAVLLHPFGYSKEEKKSSSRRQELTRHPCRNACHAHIYDTCTSCDGFTAISS